MSNNPVGFLPYGSNDPSVILQHPLTSMPTTTDIPSAGIISQTTSGQTQALTPTFDPELGMLSRDSTGAPVCLRVQNLVGREPLDWHGQIEFQVQRQWLAAFDAAGTLSGSNGYDPVGTQYALSVLGAVSNADLIGKDAGGLLMAGGFGTSFNTNYWSGTTESPGIHTDGKDHFITVNMGWSGGKVSGLHILQVDGVPLTKGTRNHATISSLFNYIYIGSGRTQPNSFLVDHHMRHLQIATRPPTITTHPKLAHLMIWGDSVVGSATVNLAPSYDTSLAISIVREIAKRGIYPGKLTARSNGGFSINDSASGGSNTGALQSDRAAMLALRPTGVVLRAGTNDMAANVADAATVYNFDADLKDHITTIMGTSGVEFVILPNIFSWIGASGIGQYGTNPRNNLVAMNALMAAIPDWWDTANPSRVGRVVHVDCFSRLGGDNPGPRMYKGQLSGALDDGHPASMGTLLMGQQIGHAVLKLLAKL